MEASASRNAPQLCSAVFIRNPSFMIQIGAYGRLSAVSMGSKQAGDSAVLVYVHLFGRGHFGQAGHGHDVAGEGDQEPGAGGHLNIAYRDGEAPGRARRAALSEKEY